MTLEKTSNCVNETFEQYSAIGEQLRSKKTTEARYKFEKASKGGVSNTFKQDLVVRMPKMNLPHAHY